MATTLLRDSPLHLRVAPFSKKNRGRAAMAHSSTCCSAHKLRVHVWEGLPMASRVMGVSALASLSLLAGPAFASQKVGEFAASGFIFKDSVEVVSVEDPEVEGITIYISDFKRSLADKLSKDFFTEPSQASVTCAATGPVRIKDINRIKGSEGGEVFSESKGLNLFQNKTLRVRRLYDAVHNTLTYIAYSTRMMNSDTPSAGRYRTSVCALPISPEVSAAAAAAQI